MVGCEGPLEVGESKRHESGTAQVLPPGEIRLHGWVDLMTLRLWMEKAGFTLPFGKQNGTVHRHRGPCPGPCFISALLPLHPASLSTCPASVALPLLAVSACVFLF